MDLGKWLDLTKTDRREFAERIGVNVSLLYAFLRKEKRLGDDNKLLVEKETNGEVTVRDLIIPEEEMKRVASGA